MELRHLRYALAVAEDLNFNRAAERLHVSQSALSKQVRELEEELGIDLFKRDKRKVEITEAGRLFLAEARRTLDQAEHARETARRAARGEIGSLHVGVEASSIYLPVSTRIQKFRATCPNVAVHVHELPSLQQLDALTDGTLDIGFIVQPIAVGRQFNFRPVFHEALFAALPVGHPLAERSRITLPELADDNFLFVPETLGCGFHNLVADLFKREGMAPCVVRETTQFQTLLSFVSQAMGVTLVPDSARVMHIPGTAYVPLDAGDTTVEIVLVWPKNRVSPVVEAFLDAVGT